jgi:hypothetical protein
MRYEVSHKDRSIHVICRAGEFYELPHEILHLSAGEGEINRLKPAYRALLGEQSFVVVYRHLLEFSPEGA